MNDALKEEVITEIQAAFDGVARGQITFHKPMRLMSMLRTHDGQRNAKKTLKIDGRMYLTQ